MIYTRLTNVNEAEKSSKEFVFPLEVWVLNANVFNRRLLLRKIVLSITHNYLWHKNKFYTKTWSLFVELMY